MEVFRELTIRGEPDRLAATMDEVEKRLTRGWTRDRGLEERLRTHSILEFSHYCFRAEDVPLLPPADLFLVEQDRGVLKVTNIVPRDQPQLSIGQYNALLEEFCEDFARPCAQKRDVEVEMTSNHAELRQWLSKTSERKLLAFSALASKGTGGALPADRRRWLDFALNSQREGGGLPAPILSRWLVEVEGWDPDAAERLAGEYLFLGEVLSYSREAGVPA